MPVERQNPAGSDEAYQSFPSKGLHPLIRNNSFDSMISPVMNLFQMIDFKNRIFEMGQF